MTNIHQPAMLPQEAALLPAMGSSGPGHLVMPFDPTHFVPAAQAATAATPIRRGSAAGRAILHTGGVNLPGVSAMTCQARRKYIDLEQP